MSKERIISPEFVKRALDYDPKTGKLTWKVRPESDFTTRRGYKIFKSLFEGEEAFTCVGPNGYLCGRMKGVTLLAHRVAYVIMTGEWPPEQVDHQNGDRTDNRWSNLRAATQSLNSRNSAMPKRNTSGRIGVGFDKSRNRWFAQGRVDGVQFNLGRFDSKQEAIAARVRFEREHNFHENHGRAA